MADLSTRWRDKWRSGNFQLKRKKRENNIFLLNFLRLPVKLGEDGWVGWLDKRIERSASCLYRIIFT